MTTFACIGGGPSVTAADVELLAGRCMVIAINDAYRLAPWADFLYAADQKWWTWHQGVPSFTRPRYAIDGGWQPVTQPGVRVLRNTGPLGLELDPTGLRAGRNSGYQAINLAVHLGAKRILLLGYDMGPDGTKTHWFGEHPDTQPSPYDEMIAAFDSLVAPLAEIGVQVLNCSRRTRLKAFPIVPLETALAMEAAA